MLDYTSVLLGIMSILQGMKDRRRRRAGINDDIAQVLENLSILNQAQLILIKFNSAYETFLAISAGSDELNRFDDYSRFVGRLLSELPITASIPRLETSAKSSESLPLNVSHRLEQAAYLVAMFLALQENYNSLGNEILAVRQVASSDDKTRMMLLFNRQTEELKIYSNKLIAIFGEVQAWILDEVLASYRGL